MGLMAVAGVQAVVYVNNDPIVMSHAKALLTSDPRGRCVYLEADARDVPAVLAGAAETLDFSEPVAVTMLGLLHFIPDADDPFALPGRYLDAFPPGSYLAISHASSDIESPGQAAGASRYNAQTSTQVTLRSREEFARFFGGLEFVPPGIASLGSVGTRVHADRCGCPRYVDRARAQALNG
jgi:S-adenosyl methyltransferase